MIHTTFKGVQRSSSFRAFKSDGQTFYLWQPIASLQRRTEDGQWRCGGTREGSYWMTAGKDREIRFLYSFAALLLIERCRVTQQNGDKSGLTGVTDCLCQLCAGCMRRGWQNLWNGGFDSVPSLSPVLLGLISGLQTPSTQLQKVWNYIDHNLKKSCWLYPSSLGSFLKIS